MVLKWELHPITLGVWEQGKVPPADLINWKPSRQYRIRPNRHCGLSIKQPKLNCTNDPSLAKKVAPLTNNYADGIEDTLGWNAYTESSVFFEIG